VGHRQLELYRTDCEYGRDKTLSFHWKVDKDLLNRIVPSVSKKNYDRSLNSILTEAVLAYEGGQKWVSYSRRKEFYSDRRRYCGTAYTYTNVIQAVETASRLGLIEDERAIPGDHLRTGLQSRLRAQPALVEAYREARPEFETHEVIRLRNADKELIPYRDTDNTRRMRGEIERINDFLLPITVDLDAPEVSWTDRHLVIERSDGERQYIRLTPPHVFRVFSRSSFGLNGRLHGWWQSVPKRLRPLMRINGETVVEPDFEQMHASILYAQRGLPLEGDAYDVDGFPRNDAKLAFNIGLNAKTTQSAVGAITEKLDAKRGYAAQLLKAVKSRHREVADAFGSDMGVKLMRVDSTITLGAMKLCLKRGIPALPIHDSIMAQHRHGGQVAEIMVQSFSSQFPGASPCKVKI
jgi:hypothetical protein